MKQKISHDVFVSHSSRDGEFALRLSVDLAAAGLSVWIDTLGIKPGDSFQEAISRALQQSRFVLAIMSPDYFQSRWTQQEWLAAIGAEINTGAIRVIPILYRDCEIPEMLRTKQWADFRNPTSYPGALGKLVRDIHALKASDGDRSPPSAEKVISGERVTELDAAAVSQVRAIVDESMKSFAARPTVQLAESPAQKNDTIKNSCFIVMPFGIESLNIVYEDFVRPTLEQRCKLKVERGDDVFGSNVIMDDIAHSIRSAELIIADLTGRNANVFYEVGIAHALNKQVLLMTQSIDDVPFDLRHRRALVYEYSPRGCKKLETSLFENVQKMLT